MASIHYCDRRILLEDRVLLARMVSLDVLRLRIPSDKLNCRALELCISSKPNSVQNDLHQDIFANCVASLCAKGDLFLYVADPERAYGYRVRPETILTACRCWSALEAIVEGRFVTKPALLCHGSNEIKLGGQALYVPEAQAYRSFRQRPTSPTRVKEIAKAIIDDAVANGESLINEELLKRLKETQQIWAVSDSRIMEIANELKPDDWRKPGRRRMGDGK